MKHGQKWDALSVVALVLCFGPEIVTSFHLGLPSDLFWWEWLTVVPIAAVMLATPQLVMLAFVRASRAKLLRFVYLAASVAMLGIYYRFLTTADLTSSSTAGAGLFFLSIYMALVSAAGAGVLFGAHRLLLRTRN